MALAPPRLFRRPVIAAWMQFIALCSFDVPRPDLAAWAAKERVRQQTLAKLDDDLVAPIVCADDDQASAGSKEEDT